MSSQNCVLTKALRFQVHCRRFRVGTGHWHDSKVCSCTVLRHTHVRLAPPSMRHAGASRNASDISTDTGSKSDTK